MIRLSNISKSFDSVPVLEDISFTIEEGDKLCIIGQSGIGKSVTIKLITGLIELDSGEIWIDGKEISGFDTKAWSEVLPDFGVIFQGGALFDSLSIFENVGLRLIEEAKLSKETIKQRVVECLASVGMDETVLNKYPSELSGGMKKRVAIARGIIHRPKYVIYDEPTSGLDPVNSGMIDDLIEKLSKEEGRTSIIVTHDMITVKQIASQVAFIHEGKLQFYGTPQALFGNQDPTIKRFLKRTIQHG